MFPVFFIVPILCIAQALNRGVTNAGKIVTRHRRATAAASEVLLPNLYKGLWNVKFAI